MRTAGELRAACAGRPGRREDFPFGPDTPTFEVGGRIYALWGLDAQPLWLNLKGEPELAEELRRAYPAVTPGYHMNPRHWNTLRLDGSLPDALVLELLARSYELVVAGLPRRVRLEHGL